MTIDIAITQLKIDKSKIRGGLIKMKNIMYHNETNTFEDIEATLVVTDVSCLFVSLSNGPYQILSVKSPSEFPLNEQPCKTNFLRLFKQFFLSRVQPLAYAHAVTDWPISCRLFLNDLILLLFILEKNERKS